MKPGSLPIKYSDAKMGFVASATRLCGRNVAVEAGQRYPGHLYRLPEITEIWNKLNYVV